jgi:uncharacterized protein involved in oxidation of intracellular sulfur
MECVSPWEFCLEGGRQGQGVLIGKGSRGGIFGSDRFKVTDQTRSFVNHGGKIFVCGTCLKIRELEGSDLCPISTMKDLYEIVRESDRVITF